MICFRERLDAEARKWSWLGINKDTYSRTHGEGAYKWHYDVEHVGFKYHGNSIMAAIALVALRYLDEDNAHRRAARRLVRPRLRVIRGSTVVPMPPAASPSRHLYQVLVDERDEVMRGAQPPGHLPRRPLPRQHRLPHVPAGDGTCPQAERASESVISLPLHLGLSLQDETRVTETLRPTW